MIETKTSKLPAILYFATFALFVAFGIGIAIAAGIYDYTFSDVFTQLGIIFIFYFLLSAIILIKGALLIPHFTDKLKADGNEIEITCRQKLKKVTATVSTDEIELVYCVQSLFEKIVKQGAVRIKVKGKKAYCVRGVTDAVKFTAELQNIIKEAGNE